MGGTALPSCLAQRSPQPGCAHGERFRDLLSAPSIFSCESDWGTAASLAPCSALTPPHPQLRASKDDCQREKEEKEKLKKMLKQHKQVGWGKALPGGGAGTGEGLGLLWAVPRLTASLPTPHRFLGRGCTLTQCQDHWAPRAPCTSTSTAPPCLTPCTMATTNGSRSATHRHCRASTRRDRTSTIIPQ